ncbi:MAG: WD40 repeat domain-containing protein [Actinomycetaceae bacterium]|nr:WD40 repeat domain-containing protein [Actinomycetaceae bacterium]
MTAPTPLAHLRQIYTLQGNGTDVRHLCALTRYGSPTVVVARDDGQITLWDLPSGLPVIRPLTADNPVTALHEMEDGRSFMYAAANSVHHIEADSLRTICSVVSPYSAPINALASTSDFLIAADTEGNIILWRRPSYSYYASWKAHNGPVVGLAPTRGQQLLTAAYGERISLWTMPKGETDSSALFPLPDIPLAATGVFSLSHQHIAVTNYDSSVLILSPGTPAHWCVLNDGFPLWAVASYPDSAAPTHIISAGDVHGVWLWEADHVLDPPPESPTAAPASSLPPASPVAPASPKNRTVATAQPLRSLSPHPTDALCVSVVPVIRASTKRANPHRLHWAAPVIVVPMNDGNLAVWQDRPGPLP